MKLIIKVEEVKGRCPCYEGGEQIVLDDGFRLNTEETDRLCMHSLAPLMPFYVAIAKGVPPEHMGLAKKGKNDGKAYIHCPDPCGVTGGGTVLMSIKREDYSVGCRTPREVYLARSR